MYTFSIHCVQGYIDNDTVGNGVVNISGETVIAYAAYGTSVVVSTEVISVIGDSARSLAKLIGSRLRYVTDHINVSRPISTLK